MIEKITKEIRKMVIDHFAYHGETISATCSATSLKR